MARHDRTATQAQGASITMRAQAPGGGHHALTIAIASVLGATAAPASAQTAIVLDTTRATTSTTVTTVGTTTNVTTATQAGATAFNSFSTFNVGNGDTVNLRLPTGASNLVNLVWDQKVSINGLLNSYVGATGTTLGGRVFFAAPNGFVVGSTGVLNVGALSVATPRTDEMLRLATEVGSGGSATNQLLRGQLATGNATVDIAGRINALDDVRIQARAIDVSGTIFVEAGSGADKLDSQVAVNTGAPAGTRLVQDGNTILLVAQDAVLGGKSAVNLKAGSTLRANGGDVIVQSDDAITTDGAINTRGTANALANPGAGVASTGASGDVTIAGRVLDIGGTIDASATATHTAGDVRIEARARDGVPFGVATAESSATVRGALTGRDVSVTAESAASSSWEFDPNKPEELPEIAVEKLSNVLGMLGVIDVGFLRATSKATVDITGTARLQAARDATVAAKTTTTVQTKASTKGNGLNNSLVVAGIGAAYGELDAAATVNVRSGATINAGNDVAIKADTINTLTVSAITLTTGTQPIAATVAISDAQIDATADVARGATITGRKVGVTAFNESDFKTTAKATSDQDGQVGIAGAISLQNVNATATNAADMSGITSLNVDATSHTGANVTGAKTAVGKSGFRILMAQKMADAQLAIVDRMTKGLGSRSGIIGQQSQGSGQTKDFRLGSSLAYVDAAHTANATLADATTINASGAVTIGAKVQDEGISQVAGASTASNAKEKNGSDVSISAAMNFGQYRHDANARVGRNASITADTVGVLGTVDLPLGISSADLASIGTFFSTIDDVIMGEQDELTPLDLSRPITSMVSAKAKGEKLGLGGAVNYMQTTNRATAWVDDGATLNARTVDVKALTDLVAIHVAGKPSPTGSSKGSAVGGTFNDVIYDNTTIAGIGADTTVTASSALNVDAQSKNIAYIIAPTAGTAQDEAIAGMVTIADTSDTTHASISNDAKVTSADVNVTATQDDLLVSAAGALSKGDEAGIGLSVAVNNRSTDTRAYIGDTSKDAKAATGVDHAAPSTVDGFVATDALDVGAQSRGLSVALSIAGGVAKNEDPNKPKGEPGFLDKLKTSVNDKKKALNDKANSVFTNTPGLSSLFGTTGGGAAPVAAAGARTMSVAGSSPAERYQGPTKSTGLPADASEPTKSTGQPPMTASAQAQAAGADPKPQPKFGLSVSGSAAVNMARQTTVASIDGATVKARTPTGTQSTTVQALNSAELASASGSAAVTRAQAPGGKFNAAMAGAVAYGLIDNTTQATVNASTLASVDDLTVRALNVGEHTAIGISVGAEVSGGSTTSTSFSGSFSVAQIGNDTRAAVDGSTVTGADIAGATVDVTAYDRSRIGIGGGSLYVNTSTGSNANVGAAFTYAETGNRTTVGVSGGRLTNIDAFTLRAIDSTLIGSAAAMGGGGAQANGFAGAVVWNAIGNTTTATIDGGAVVTVDGDIAVSARASAPVTTLDALVAGGVRNASGYDFSGATLFTNSNSAIPAGTSIISVAGLVQAGKNNVGLSFVGSNVANTHEVSIGSATLNAGTSRIDLDASDNTAIIAATVGVGVAKGEFAGLGSATANMIGNTSRVKLAGTTVNAGTLDAQSRDDSAIWSLAGNVTVSKGTAAGAAVSYNKLGNTVESLASGSTLNVATIGFGAESRGDVMAGAVAGAVSKDVAVGGSFGWTESANRVTAAVDGGAVNATALTIAALNDTSLRTLSGSVGIGRSAGIGAAFNTVLIQDSTTARLDGAKLAATGDVVVKADGTGEAQSLAVAGAASQGVAVSGSDSNSIVNNDVTALAQNLRGAAGGNSAATAKTLGVQATSTMDIDSLAGAVAGAQSAAVGGAVSVNTIGGATRATLAESVLGVTQSVDVKAASSGTIDTLAVAGSGAAQGAFAGAMTTNFVTSTVAAKVSDTGSANNAHTLTVSADDASKIQSLAGAAGVAGNAGVGASIAVNRIATDVDAAIEGGNDGRQYKAGEVVVSAVGRAPTTGTGANIRTVAVGVGGGADIGGAGSLAINLLDNDVKARIANGANVLSNNNVAVTADNRQGIDVLAGSVAFGGTVAGVGIGLVVNDIRGETVAEISGAATQVSALAQGAGRSVNDNALSNPSATDVSNIAAIGDYTVPDLAVGTRTVNGIAVNALNRQHVATVGAGLALSANPLGSISVAAVAGTNITGGTTRATIDGARINQASGAATDQAIDVRAGSHAVNANFIVGVAGGGTVSATGAVASNVFSKTTEASIVDATTRAAGGVNVDAFAGHNSVALSVGLSGALVGGAGSASINVFDTRNRAFVAGGTLDATSLDVGADTVNRVNLISGAGAAGGVGIAGSFLVNVGSSDTEAFVGDADHASTRVTTSGAIGVDASSTSIMKGVAVSGAAGGGAGVAGMAGVSVIANSTKAWLRNATTNSSKLDVGAHETVDLSSYAGALGLSTSGYGVGAAANVAVLSSTTSADIASSTVTSSGAVTVDADSTRNLDAITVTAGVGGTAGIGGAASLLLVGLGDRGDTNSELNKGGDGTLSKVGSLASGNRVDGAVSGSMSDSERSAVNTRSAFDLTGALAGSSDSVSARVSNSGITSASLKVDADSLIGIRNIAGAAGGGAVGIGGAIAYTGVYDTTTAGVDAASTVKTTGGVEVSADSGDASASRRAGDAHAYAGGAGLVGIGAAIGIANVNRTTTASAGGSINGGATATLDVRASDTSSVKAEGIGAAAGAASVGIVVSDASKRSAVTATIASTTANKASIGGFGAVDIAASSAGDVIAEGTGAAAGLLYAGTGVGVTARDTSVVRATVGDGATVNTKGAGTSLSASATPKASATALGVAVGGNAGLGAAIAIARADVDVAALTGNNVSFGGTGALNLDANVLRSGTSDLAYAKSTAGTGGVLFGGNASVAEATSAAKASASTGDDVKLSSGAVNVQATSTTSQFADATGVAVGALALGASVSKAASDTRTTASLGARNSASTAIGDLVVKADATDRNRADTTAGAGGVVSGNAARADTSVTSTTSASIGAGTQLAARRADVSATHDSRFAGTANSVNASFVGASGAGIGHVANATVDASVGDNAKLTTVDDIRIDAQNRFHSDGAGASVSAAGGGVLNGSAALVDVALTGNTRATIGSGAKLATGLTTGANGRAGDIHLLASTIADTSNSGELTTGGAIDVAVVTAKAAGNFSNAARIGDNATLDTYGYINVGTYTQADLRATALVNTWGLAAVGVSDSDVDVVSTQDVTVGAGASLEAFRNVYVTAGRDSRNLHDTRLNAESTSQGYVRGLIAVPNSSAEGHTRSDATAWTKSGSDLTSTGNVTLGAYTGTQLQTVDGTGHGYELGFIPVTQRDSSSGSAGRGGVTLDGSAIAGRYNTLTLVINADGTVTQSDGLPVTWRTDASFNPRAWLDGVNCSGGNAGDDGCKGLAALKNSVANSAIGGTVLGPMFAGGGDVFLNGDVIAGSGSATAKGAPTITVTNNANRALLVDEITLPDYAGGNVRFTGIANTAGNVRITQAPSTAKPTVSIHNAGTASNPGAPIFLTGDIRNLGGLVRVRNDQGSLGQFATIYAQQQIVEAPNGIVTFNNLGKDWQSGSNPRSDWLGWGRPSTPNETVSYVANDYYDASGRGLIYRDGGGSYGGASVVLWGDCLPHYGGNCDYRQYPYGYLDFAYDGNGGKTGIDMPDTPSRSLYRTAGYGDNGAVATNAANSSFVGQQIYVRAKYIDVNSTIDAGAGTNWSLKVAPGMQAWIDGLGANAQGLYDIPSQYLARIDGSSRLVNARWDATNKRIVVDNVNASGGGYVYLDGNIVSSTPYGKIKVSSGFGKVAIESGVNASVQVNDINVGNGAVGVIEIVDRQKTGYYGNPYTTWFVSQQGQGTRAFDNSNGATSYENGVQLGSAAAYNPQAGMRFRWTETARVGRDGPAGAWSWVDASGKRVDSGQQWDVGDGEYFLGTAGGAAFTQTITGGFTSVDYQAIDYGCSGQYGGCNYGFPAIPGGNRWDTSRNGGDGGWETSWLYARPTQGWITLSNSVKADNSIAIDFSGNAIGSIDIKAQGDLLVNGRLVNGGGNTTLTTVASSGGVGNVLRTGDVATVTTRNLKVNSAAGLGGAGNLFEVTLTDNGTLDASTAGYGQYVRLLSGGAVRMTDSGYGTIVLDANGSITGLTGAARDITGGDLFLTSRFGSLGTLASPLKLEARELSFWGWKFGGRVNANALGDIALTDYAGDFAVNKVVSDSGNVRLEAATGSLVDARARTGAGVLDESARQAIWGRLKLDGSGVAASVAAYEQQVNARYQEYWRLLDVGSVSNGAYTLNAASIALFRPLAEAAAGRSGLSDAEVKAYAAGRYNDAGSTFATAFGNGWRTQSAFVSKQANFSFTLDVNSAQYAELAKNAAWTQGQLKYAINANALEPASGAVGQADPNVQGRNVTLVARDNVGRLAADRNLGYAALTNGTISDDDAIALALANAPGDVLLVRGDGHVYTRNELLALTPTDIAGGAIATVRVKQTSPLVVQLTGKLDGSAGQAAFLQANGDLAIDRFTTNGDARIAATGSIVSGRSDNAASLIVGGDLVLLAGNGRIGATASSTDTNALVASIAGRLLSASAGQDVRVRDLDGDLRVGTVFADGTIGLESSNGSIVSVLDGLSLDGQSIELLAKGDIGHRNALTGALDGALTLRTGATGTLSGRAGGEARIVSPDRALRITSFDTQGALRVTATQNDLTADTLRVGGALNLAAGSDLHVVDARSQDATLIAVGDAVVGMLDTRNATIAAGGSLRVRDILASGDIDLDSTRGTTIDTDGRIRGVNVELDAASLAMGARSRVNATGDITIDTRDDMTLGALVLDDDSAGKDVVLRAGGRIDANGDGQTNVRGGGRNTLAFASGTGVGTRTQRVAIEIGATTGRATAGDIDLRMPHGGRIDNLVADAGGIDVSADDRLDLGVIRASGALQLAARGDVVATTLQAGADLGATASGAINVVTLQAGQDVAVNAGRGLTFDTLTAGRDAALTAGRALDARRVDVARDLTATAGTTAAFDRVDAGRAALLYSAGDMALASLKAGTLDLGAGGRLDADRIEVLGDATLDVRGALAIDSATVDGTLRGVIGGDTGVRTLRAGALDLDVGGTLGLRVLDVANATVLRSGGATTIERGRIGGGLDARAGDTLRLDDLRVQGNAALAATQDVVLGIADVRGTLAATAGRDARATTLAVAGATRLDATRDLALGTATFGSAFEARAGRDLAATMLATGGDARLAAGNDATLGRVNALGGFTAVAAHDLAVATLDAKRDVALDAGRNLRLDDARVTGTLRTTSTAATVFNTVRVDGDAALAAGATLGGRRLTVGGNATTSSGKASTIDVLTVAGTLASTAGGTLAIAAASVGGNATLDAGDDIALGNAIVGGSLEGKAGNDVRATALAVARATTLDATRDIVLGTATLRDTLDATAGNTVDAAMLTVTGATTLAAANDVVLGNAAIGGTLDVAAGHDLRATTLAATGATTLDAGSDIALGTATLGDTLNVKAGQDLTATQLDVTGAAKIDAGRDIVLDAATLRSTLDAKAGKTVSATTLTVAGAAALTADNNIVLGSAAIGSTLDAKAGNDIAAVALDVTGATTLEAGNDIALGDATIGGTLDGTARNDVRAATLAVTGATTLAAGNNLALGAATVGDAFKGTAGQTLTATQLGVTGATTLDAGRDIVLDTAVLRGTFDAKAGNDIAAGALDVTGATTLAAGNDIALGTATLGDALNGTAGQTLTATQLDVTGAAMLEAGRDIVLDTAVLRGTLDAKAGNDIAAGAFDVTGATSLAAANDIALRTATFGSTLDGNAGRDFAATQLGAAGAIALAAGRNLVLGTATLRRTLDAKAGNDITAATLVVTGATTLAAGNDIALGDATIGGTLDGTGRNDVRAATLAVTGATTLTAGNNLVLGTATLGDGFAGKADQDLTVAMLAVTGATVLAAGHDMSMDTATLRGTLDAEAADDVRVTTLAVTGATTIDAGRDIVLDTAGIGGTFDARSGRNLNATTATIAGATTLAAGNDIALGAATVGDALRSTAGQTLTATQLDVTGATTLDAGRDIVLDIATLRGTLASKAGNDVRSTMLVAAGATTFDAGNDIALGRAALGGTFDGRARNDVRAVSLAVSGATTLDAGHDIALGTAMIGDAFGGTAGRDIVATQLDIGGDAMLAAGNDATLGTAGIGGNTDIDATRDLRAGTLAVRGDAMLDAGRAMTLDVMRTDANVAARAGDAMTIGTLATGTDATLAAGTLVLADGTVGRTLDARTVSDLRIDTARIGTDAMLRAGAAMTLGTVAAGHDLDASSTGTLRFADLDGGRDVLLASTTADVLGGNAQAGRDLRINGARRIDADALRAGNDVALAAGADIDGDTVQAGRDVIAQAGTDIALRSVDAGRSVALDAGEVLRLGTVKAGTDIALTAGADVDFGTLRAGRDLAVRSRRGHVDGDVLAIGGNARLQAATDATLGDATVGRDLGITAGRDIGIDRYGVGGAVTFGAARDIRIGEGRSVGAQSLVTGGSLGFGTLASDTRIDADARGGRIDGKLLIAPVADLDARDAIALDMARIGSRLNMASATIDANVLHTGPGVLATRLTGYRDGIARRIDLSVDARDGWLMETLATLQADFDTTASNVSIADGYIGGTMRLDTRDAKLWMDNLGATLRVADVQFMELDKRFMLVQTGVHTLTDAYVVRFSPGFRVEVPNYVAPHDPRALNYRGESALRYTVRTLSADDARDGDDDTRLEERRDVIESGSSAAVNIGAAP